MEVTRCGSRHPITSVLAGLGQIHRCVRPFLHRSQRGRMAGWAAPDSLPPIGTLVPAPVLFRRNGAARLPSEIRRARCLAVRGIRRLWKLRIPHCLFCPAGLLLGFTQVPQPGGPYRRFVQQPAHEPLRPGVDSELRQMSKQRVPSVWNHCKWQGLRSVRDLSKAHSEPLMASRNRVYQVPSGCSKVQACLPVSSRVWLRPTHSPCWG